MWWIISFVALCTVISVVIARRGSTGASRADDLPSNHQPGTGHGGYVGGGAGGFGGGADGGGGA
jgi:hypothetical protein